MLSKRGERGDTIVEVLICLAVLGLVLSGAYVTANRNSLANRSAQERLEAVKLAEAQIERLRTAVQANPAIVNTMTGFCLPSDAPALAPVSSSDGKCTVKADDMTAAPDVAPRYAMSITRVAAIPPTVDGVVGHRYRVTATWENISGTGSDKLDTYYEVYR